MMKKCWICRVLLLIAAGMASGCASIVSKSQYNVHVTSDPPGARVEVRNQQGEIQRSLQTPQHVSLRASQGFFSPARYTFEFSKDGYRSMQRNITAEIDQWYFGNCLLGGLIGLLLVDPVTGAMYKLDDQVHVNLIPAAGTPATPTPPVRDQESRDPPDLSRYPLSGASVAILTFNARGGLPEAEVDMFSDRFESEFIHTRTHQVVSRERMREVLEFREFNISCVTTECAVEAGRGLGVQYMVYGSIGRLGGLFTVHAYMVSIETGAIVGSATLDFRGSKEDLLIGGMRDVVHQLLLSIITRIENS